MSLRAESVSFSYPGRAPLYRAVDFAVEPGECVAVNAPSGAGKTTLCRLLSGYLAPTAGRITVDGEALPTRRRSGAPCPVQLIAQHPEQAFDPRMRMARSLAEACADEGLLGRLRERFGIREAWLTRLPHELSGGELMRFCMVRALSVRPRYLICDEATAMLDVITQAELWHVLMDEAERCGRGIVMVSHDPALVARVATRTVALGELKDARR